MSNSSNSHIEVLAAFELAVALDPRVMYARLGKGDALDDLNRPLEALVAFRQALALDPKGAGAWDGKIDILGE